MYISLGPLLLKLCPHTIIRQDYIHESVHLPVNHYLFCFSVNHVLLLSFPKVLFIICFVYLFLSKLHLNIGKFINCNKIKN